MDIRDVDLKGYEHVISSIEDRMLYELKLFAQSRINDIARGAETPQLAALLVEKYGYGMAKAAEVVGLNINIHNEVDVLVREINPDQKLTNQLRWNARPAALVMTPPSENKNTL